jgi:RNA polymerase sigma-70 factor, ECF subfamily
LAGIPVGRLEIRLNAEVLANVPNRGLSLMTERAEESAGLVVAARAGCRDALGRVLEACRPYLLVVAGRQLDAELRSKGGASDLVQETFLEAQRDFARFQGSSPDELRAWLRQVLLHNVGAFSRRFRTTGKREVGREVALQFDGGTIGVGCEPAGSAVSPSGVAIEHEEALALRRALERLPADYRRVVVLRFEEGRSFEEIGRLTDRSPDAARKVWARAMERLRQEWNGPS